MAAAAAAAPSTTAVAVVTWQSSHKPRSWHPGFLAPPGAKTPLPAAGSHGVSIRMPTKACTVAAIATASGTVHHVLECCPWLNRVVVVKAAGLLVAAGIPRIGQWPMQASNAWLQQAPLCFFSYPGTLHAALQHAPFVVGGSQVWQY
jgi:hypothetical protein